MTSDNYPRTKVFFAFLLCPFFSGLAAVPIMLATIMVSVFKRASLIGEVRGSELLSLFITIPMMAQLIFFLPALMLAVFVAFFKLKGRLSVCWAVSSVGAIVSSVWMFCIVFFFISKVEDYEVLRNMLPVFLSFVLGGISTGLAAYWFLPQPLHIE